MRKCVIADLLQSARQGYLYNRLAMRKCVIADLGERAWKRNALKSETVTKCPLGDQNNSLGDHYILQTLVILKCPVAYLLYRHLLNIGGNFVLIRIAQILEIIDLAAVRNEIPLVLIFLPPCNIEIDLCVSVPATTEIFGKALGLAEDSKIIVRQKAPRFNGVYFFSQEQTFQRETTVERVGSYMLKI